jgi:NAD(P)-dependent dehydrogenase (short-subunit alcohol dehydrogenase family)
MIANFDGHKLVVVGGSSGMGRESAADVVAGGGSAVIIGRDQDKVDDTVATLSKDGQAYGITANLADREHVARVQQQLADDHADATLLVNAAGFFIPKSFLEHDGVFYDAYLELDRAIFFLTQTVVRGMVEGGRGGAIVNIGSMWAHQAIAATPSSAYSVAKAGLHALTHNLAIELAPYKIRVNARSRRQSSPRPSTKLSFPRRRSRRRCTDSMDSIRSAELARRGTSHPPSPSSFPRKRVG